MDNSSLADIYERLGRMEAKMEHILHSLGEYKVLESRVDNLERWRSYLAGALAVVSFVVTASGAHVFLGGSAEAPEIVVEEQQ